MELRDFGPSVAKRIQGRDISLGAFCEFDDDQGTRFFCANCCKEILTVEFGGLEPKETRTTDEKFEVRYSNILKEIENLDVSDASPECQAIIGELKRLACTNVYVPFKIPPDYKTLFTADEIDRRSFAYLKSDSKIICSKCKAVCE